MAISQEYNSQISREYFMFYEMRIVAKLMARIQQNACSAENDYIEVSTSVRMEE